MSKKVLIASDSTCDLSPELIEKYGIKLLPLNEAWSLNFKKGK